MILSTTQKIGIGVVAAGIVGFLVYKKFIKTPETQNLIEVDNGFVPPSAPTSTAPIRQAPIDIKLFVPDINTEPIPLTPNPKNGGVLTDSISLNMLT